LEKKVVLIAITSCTRQRKRCRVATVVVNHRNNGKRGFRAQHAKPWRREMTRRGMRLNIPNLPRLLGRRRIKAQWSANATL